MFKPTISIQLSRQKNNEKKTNPSEQETSNSEQSYSLSDDQLKALNSELRNQFIVSLVANLAAMTAAAVVVSKATQTR